MRQRPLDREAGDVDYGQTSTSSVRDDETLSVTRKRQEPGLASDSHPPGHLPFGEIDPNDLIADADGDEGLLAIVRENDPARLGADLDPADHLEPIVLPAQDRQVVAIPVRDHPDPTILTQSDARRPVTRRDLAEDLSGDEIDEGNRP
jgi:hypothetical protein